MLSRADTIAQENYLFWLQPQLGQHVLVGCSAWLPTPGTLHIKYWAHEVQLAPVQKFVSHSLAPIGHCADLQ